MKRRSFLIKTLGCKVNQYESQAIREILTNAGHRETTSRDRADICILNTCTVTNEADKESLRYINRFVRLNPRGRIIITGCYAPDAAKKFGKDARIIIVKNSEKAAISALIDKNLATKYANNPLLTISKFKGHTKAFLKIQDGCRHFCSYCKVPYVRGQLTSKPIELILKECAALIRSGYKEIVLTGICLGSWGSDLASDKNKRQTIVDVLIAISALEGSFRIRLSSIEPTDVSDALIDLMAHNRTICRHLHIPLQSGDDTTLRQMNRHYTTRRYAALIRAIRAKVRGVAITTDVMVGFPTETDGQFAKTAAFLRTIATSRTHIFTYSPRAGTKAAGIVQTAGTETVRKRYARLSKIALTAAKRFHTRFIGKTLDVLVETKRDPRTGLLTGYSDNYIRVLFDGPDSLRNSLTSVRIISADEHSAIGSAQKH